FLHFARNLDGLENRQTRPLALRLSLRGQPNLLANGWLVVQKVGKTHGLKDAVDLLLQHHPNGPDAAIVGGRAPLFLNGVADTVKVEGLQLRGVNHVANRDLSGRLRENVPAPRAPSAGDHASAAESEQDLLDVVSREPLLSRDLASIDWT
ncbi:MAG TPA: hypothetical protein VGO08_09470, partial [Burkholderiales bacterium]|nr:hypothetical protein [Burkholderiales bacterium]